MEVLVLWRPCRSGLPLLYIRHRAFDDQFHDQGRGSKFAPGTSALMVSSPIVKRYQTKPRHDHAPDTDDVWAWIVIGLVAAGVMLAIWLPMLKVMFLA
jgi:hypothetical protein